MGKRRIRNLFAHGMRAVQITGVDPRADRRAEARKKYGVQSYSTFAQALKKVTPDVLIISTPPDRHTPYLLYAARKGKHFFVEHPTTDKGYAQLKRLKNKKQVGIPSCSFRFHPAMQLMKKIIEQGTIGRVLSFQYHMGQYLPDWHPWEDYRDVYFSKKATGACREMFAFELGWLSFVLPLRVQEISGFTGKLSGLKMTADDTYAAVLKCKNNILGTMVIDVVSRNPFRTLRVLCSDGVLEWEWQGNILKIFSAKTKKTQTIKLKRGNQLKQYINTEDMYEAEIGAFLRAINGGKPFPFSFAENHRYLKALFALERSAQTKRYQKLRN